MSFLEELRIASENNQEPLSRKIWRYMKSNLLAIASEKNEWICKVKFKNISYSVIKELEKIIEEEKIYFSYDQEKEIGIISWEFWAFGPPTIYFHADTLLILTLGESNKVYSEIVSTIKFSEVLISNSQNNNFERIIWEQIKPRLLKLARDNHSNGCHVLFENFSMTCINALKEIIENENITFDCEKNEVDLLQCLIVWNTKGFWEDYYRSISEKMIRIKQDSSGNISIDIEEIDKYGL